MRDDIVNNIKQLLAVESIRKALESYFDNLGVSLDDNMYPPIMKNMCENVPQIANRIEIQPHIDNIDPTTNYVRVGWNLFVNGMHRKWLGYTTHSSIATMETQVDDPMISDESHTYSTPRTIIDFIIDVLDKTKDYTPSGPILYGKPPIKTAKAPGTGAAGTYYQKNKLTSSTL